MFVGYPRQNVYSRWIFILRVCVSEKHLEYFMHLLLTIARTLLNFCVVLCIVWVVLCTFCVVLCIFVLFYVFLCCSMYCLFCVVLCIVCVYIRTVLLPPGGYPIVAKYIISYHNIYISTWIIKTLIMTSIFVKWVSVIYSSQTDSVLRSTVPKADEDRE
jgi:hypothetical protein